MRRPFRSRSLVALACSALACTSLSETALFSGEFDAAGGSAPSGGNTSPSAGTNAQSSAGGGGSAVSGASSADGGSAVSGASSSGGGGAGALAGEAGMGGADAGAGGEGGSPTEPIVIDDCAMVEGAITSELDGHCYRVEFQNLSFAAARDACAAADGHLATVGSKEENELLRKLHEGEHWLGATDGRPDTMPGVGPYLWVTGERWTYSEWEGGQPNAYQTDCPDDNAAVDCFEHCAFQTSEGDWNDRSCWHTIVSICEWDVAKKGAPGGGEGGVGGEGGAGDAGGRSGSGGRAGGGGGTGARGP